MFIRILKYEWKKIYKKKVFWGLIIGMFLFNIGMLFYYEMGNPEFEPYVVHKQEKEKFDAQLKVLSPKEKKEKIQELSKILEIATSIYNSTAVQKYLDEEQIQIFQEELKKSQEENKEQYEKAVAVLEENKLIILKAYVEDYITQETYKKEYMEYIATMKERASSQITNPVFQKGTFAYRNIIKTCLDFEDCEKNEIVFGEHYGVENATDFFMTNFFVYGSILLVGIYLYITEREKGLMPLLRINVNGRQKTIGAKVLLYVFLSIIICILFYGKDLFVEWLLYGFGDIDRCVQSLPQFRECEFRMTIKQYIGLWMFVKVLLGLVVAMLLMCFLQIFRSGKSNCMAAIFFVMAEYMMYIFLPEEKVWSYFKYLNLFAFWDAKNWISEYRNINFFEYPVNMKDLSCISSVLLIVVFLIIGNLFYPKRECGKETFSVLVYLEKFSTKFRRKIQSTNLIVFEIKKYFLKERMLLFFVLMLLVSGSLWNGYQSELYGDIREAVYESYMVKLEGKWNGEKEKVYQKSQQYFKTLEEEYEQLENSIEKNENREKRNRMEVIEAILSTQGEGFFVVKNQYEHMKNVSETYNMEKEYPNEYGCRKLFYTMSDDLKLFTLLMFGIACTIESLFCMEYKKNTFQLVRTTPLGRKKLFGIKYKIGIFTGIFLFCCVYIPKLLSVYQQYKTESLFCHMKMMPLFQSCGTGMTVIKGAICIMFTRLLLMLVAVSVSVTVAVFLKNYLRSLMVAFVVLLVPCVFALYLPNLRIVELILHSVNYKIMYGIWILSISSIFFFYYLAKNKFIQREGETLWNKK